jgi:hypothetical protein
MSPARLLAEAAAHGVIVTLEGDSLRLRAASEPMPALLAQFRTHKPAIVGHLRALSDWGR